MKPTTRKQIAEALRSAAAKLSAAAPAFFAVQPGESKIQGTIKVLDDGRVQVDLDRGSLTDLNTEGYHGMGSPGAEKASSLASMMNGAVVRVSDYGAGKLSITFKK